MAALTLSVDMSEVLSAVAGLRSQFDAQMAALNAKVDQLMTESERVQADLASLADSAAALVTSTTTIQALLAQLRDQVAAGTVDPALIDQLDAETQAIRGASDALAQVASPPAP